MVGGVCVLHLIVTNEIPQECLGGMWEDRSVTAKVTTQRRNACINYDNISYKYPSLHFLNCLSSLSCWRLL